MEKLRNILRKLIPSWLFTLLQPTYHYGWAVLGAVVYRAPSRRLKVIGVTGTKGKSSTVEIINHVLESAGYTTAVAGTIRFKIADRDLDNKRKQTMPGRFFQQKFLADCHQAGVDWVIMELTSEGAKQFRNWFIYLDALIFTNLSPEHIENHGGFENYKQAKLDIVRKSLVDSPKVNKAMIANTDNEHGADFLATAKGCTPLGFGQADVSELQTSDQAIDFVYKNTSFHSPLPGMFNFYNLLSVIKLAEWAGLDLAQVASSLQQFHTIPGRAELVTAGQSFPVVVDYAHTPDSLQALYETYRDYTIIAVLGNTGGGRDSWKRPEMAKIADQHVSKIILTNEDPYDEDPQAIVDAMAEAIVDTPYEIIMDRRAAIAAACKAAADTDRAAVLVTGKGTDPYIMLADGEKMPWSDRAVCKEELAKLGYDKH